MGLIYYIVIILLLYIGIKLFDKYRIEEQRNTYIFIIFLVLTLLLTLRYRMGGDALAYEHYWDYMPDLSQMGYKSSYDRFQPGWVFLVALSKFFSESIVLFQFLHAIIFNISLFIFFNRYSNYFFTSLLVLFLSLLYFYFGIEIQRETIAISIFLFNVKNLEENKYFRYYLLSLLSFMFHVSAIVLFVLPLFKLIKMNRTYYITLLVLSIVLFFFKDILLGLVAPFMINESMRDRIEIYADIEFSLLGFFSYFIIRVLFLLPFMFISSSNSRFKWFYPSYLLFSILAQFLVGFDRLINYLHPIYIVLLVDFIYEYTISFKKRVVAVFVFLHVFFIMDYKLFTTNEYGDHYYSIFYPYVNIFEKQEIPERERYYIDF